MDNYVGDTSPHPCPSLHKWAYKPKKRRILGLDKTPSHAQEEFLWEGIELKVKCLYRFNQYVHFNTNALFLTLTFSGK